MKKSLKTLGALLAPVGLVAASAIAIPLTSCSNSSSTGEFNTDNKWNWVYNNSSIASENYDEAISNGAKLINGSLLTINITKDHINNGVYFATYDKVTGQYVMRYGNHGSFSQTSIELYNQEDAKYLVSGWQSYVGKFGDQIGIPRSNASFVFNQEAFNDLTEEISIIFKFTIQDYSNQEVSDSLYFELVVAPDIFSA